MTAAFARQSSPKKKVSSRQPNKGPGPTQSQLVPTELRVHQQRMG